MPPIDLFLHMENDEHFSEQVPLAKGTTSHVTLLHISVYPQNGDSVLPFRPLLQ